ncbi:uncharacterized protein [Nicotiana tomentosiformis]|uniref:uncharacterized protein n=1 Tax=Nicotiana tomentosiformis TaxID=4098 RepID=UPI00388CE859
MICGQGREAVSEKRPHHFGDFSGASSRGRGSFGRGYSPIPIQSVLQASHELSGSVIHVDRGARAKVLAPISPLPAQPALGWGSAARGRGQAIRGGAQAIRGGGQQARGCPRVGGQSGEGQPHFYAFPTRPEAESSDAVITGIVLVCHRDASILFDPGSTYSYMSSYFASYLVMPRDSLSAHVYVFIHVGDSIIVDSVYHSCVVSIRSFETRVDLLLLDMVDVDVILGMDWLSSYHVILDYHAKMVTLSMLGLPRLEWRGTTSHSTSMVISYVKARRIAEKGCLVHLAYIPDPSA